MIRAQGLSFQQSTVTLSKGNQFARLASNQGGIGTVAFRSETCVALVRFEKTFIDLVPYFER